jgi:hypothetical protein
MGGGYYQTARRTRVTGGAARLACALVAASLAVSAAGCTVQAEDIATTGRVEYWHPTVSGRVFITKGSMPGTATEVDMDSNAGLDAGNAFSGGLDFDVGRHRVSFEYMDFSSSGATVTPEDFTFHGQNFSKGDHVSSELNSPTSRLSWSYAFWQRQESSWWAGLGARYWTFDMQMANDTTGETTSRKFSHVFPMAITDSSFDLGRGFSMLLRADVGMVRAPQAVFDGVGGFAYKMKRFGAEAGWRFMRFDFNESKNDTDFNLSGPFVALRFTF